MCLFQRTKQTIEESFPHKNWPIIMSFQLLISTIFSIMSPSVYQFITSSRTLPENLRNDQDTNRYWPGLGGTDTDYAWVQAAQPLCETGAMLVTVPLAYRLPFSCLLFAFVALAGVGGGVYALAQSVWVAFLGRGLMGAGVQFGASTIHTYIGEMGTVMDDIRQKQGKRQRKFILYIAYSFVLNGGFVVPFVLTSVMSTFGDVNPYHWPGWAVTMLAAVLGVVVLLFFRETRSLPRAMLPGTVCSGLVGLKLSAQLKSKSKIRFLTYVFVIGCSYLVGKAYAIILILITPVLDNKFGFSIEYASLFLLGVSAGFLSSSFIHLAAKFVKVNNRILLGVWLVFTLLGSVLIGDWQSIVHKDSCNLSIIDCWNNSVLEIPGSGNLNDSYPSLGERDSSVPSSVDMENGIWNCSNVSSGHQSHYEQIVDTCESLSTDDDRCFWNQQSQVTGEFCNACLPTCLSRRATLDFFQFSAGVLCMSVAAPLGFVFVSAVASEITSVESQGAMLSLLVGTGALSRAVSPIWFVESYDASGKHTYLAMAITAGCALILLLSLVILYKKLGPISLEKDEREVVEATSKLSVLCEGDHSSGTNKTEIFEIWTETPL